MAPESVRPPAQSALARPWATLLVAGFAVIVFALPAITGPFLYDRSRILDGEVWRIVTGHWVHFGISHLIWNLAIVLIAGIWSERLQPTRTRWLLAIAPVAIGAALLAVEPSLTRYAGLSGIATALVVLLALSQSRWGHDRGFWCVVLLMVAAKIAIECFDQAPVFARFDRSTIRAVPGAHMAGAALGVIAGLSRPKSSKAIG